MTEDEATKILAEIGRDAIVGRAVASKGYLTEKDAESIVADLLATWEPLIRLNERARLRPEIEQVEVVAAKRAQVEVRVGVAARLRELAHAISGS